MSRVSVLLVVTLGASLVGIARAADWADFEGSFPSLPCQDGWMGCVVAGDAVSPDLRSSPADLRVDWFSLEATAAFSPFVGLSEYAGGPAVVASASVPDPQPEDDGGDAVAVAEPSESTRKAQQAADQANVDAAAAAAAEREARRLAREAEQAARAAEAEEKRRREEEANMRREADRLAKAAVAAAAAAEAEERDRLAKEAEAAQRRAAEAEAARIAAEEASRKQREAEEEARRKAAEEERRKAEAEAARLAAEEEARRKLEEERQRQLAAEEEARRKKAEAEAEAAMREAEAEARAEAAARAEEERQRQLAAEEEEARRNEAAQADATADDAAAVVEVPKPPEPVLVDDGSCNDLTRLEPAAMLGKLTEGQVSCLEARVGSEPKMTDKEKASLVLMANAWSAGDKNAWENLVKRHLDEIDQSDPDLCYKYALHLSRQGPGRASGVIRWANVALENRTLWTGDTYTSRVFSLYKLRAASSQMLWRQAEEDHAAAPSDETRDKVDKYRNMTKVNAREWFEYAKSAGKDPTTALHLCMSAAGTKDYCEAG